MAGTCWPNYQFTEEERKGWTEEDKAEEQQRWADTKGAKADAVSRYDECVRWGLTHIANDKTRRIVWTWAFCIVIPKRSFATACKRNGWARPTAYRRLTAAMETISYRLNNESISLQVSRLDWVRQDGRPRVEISLGQENCSSAPAIKFSPGYRTEKSRDLLTSPEAIADFVKHRDMVNAERRGLQEREAKRRAKIGAMAS